MTTPLDDVPEPPVDADANSARRLTILWCALTMVLVVICVALHVWSPAFARGIELTQRPALGLAAVLVAAGLIHMLAVPLIIATLRSGHANARHLLWTIIAGGFAMRLAFMGSTPMLEDDYYRYLWDGGVTAHGFNPYAVSPDDAQGEPFSYSLQPLAQQSGIVIERINHAELTTVYPPVAQAAFALAHMIQPWSLEAWRCVCVACEIATLLLLLALLDATGRSRLWVAVYWLSPLAAKEFINSAHMDVIVVPLVLAAALLSIKERQIGATAVLGLAVGAKFWPVMLAPLILRPLTATPRRLAWAVAVFGAICAAVTLPMLAGVFDPASGLTAYASKWRNNSAHYGLLEQVFTAILKPLALDARMPGGLVRALLAVLAGAFALWTARKDIVSGKDLVCRFGLVTAAVVLLSPSQFPWYALWVLPFAVFAPWSWLLAMTVLIPIYYAGFHFSARDAYATYREGIVFGIWIPVWALLAYETWRAARYGALPLFDQHAGDNHA